MRENMNNEGTSKNMMKICQNLKFSELVMKIWEYLEILLYMILLPVKVKFRNETKDKWHKPLNNDN